MIKAERPLSLARFQFVKKIDLGQLPGWGSGIFFEGLKQMAI